MDRLDHPSGAAHSKSAIELDQRNSLLVDEFDQWLPPARHWVRATMKERTPLIRGQPDHRPGPHLLPAGCDRLVCSFTILRPPYSPAPISQLPSLARSHHRWCRSQSGWLGPSQEPPLTLDRCDRRVMSFRSHATDQIRRERPCRTMACPSSLTSLLLLLSNARESFLDRSPYFLLLGGRASLSHPGESVSSVSFVRNRIFALTRKCELLFVQLLPLLGTEVFGHDPRLPTDTTRESIG